jgi:ribose transport system permease protein
LNKDARMRGALRSATAALPRGQLSLGRQRGTSLIALVRDYGIIASFVALFVILSFWSNVFFTQANLSNLLDQWSAVGIIAIGSTILLISGGFDLSIDAVFAVSGIVAALVANSVSVELGLIAGVGIGLGFGVCNGILTTVFRINPFVATIASSVMIRGVAFVLSGGFIVVVTDPHFSSLGSGSVGTLTYGALIFLGAALVATIVLTRTSYGGYVFASGGNPEAARRAGVRVGGVRTAAYALSGLTAGIAGVLVASRTGTGQIDLRSGVTFEAITAIVVGGTSIYGGQGAIWRTVLGVLFLGMIGNGFNLLNIDPTYQSILQGGIIVSAVAVDAWAKRTA